jgi:FixJ family two-component response regulator
MTPLISIVDDDESVRLAIENLVQSLGFEAQTFVSAEAFLASPQIDATSCLISDVQMPGLSGLDLRDLLVGRGYRFSIIFITAYPSTAEQVRAQATDGVCILQKPLDNQRLIEHLEITLGVRLLDVQ